MTDRLTITRPDDWHLHLRDGAMLDAVTLDTAMHFGRALIMPNLVPPVVTGSDAAAYRDRIIAACPEGASFTPMMTLYLTEGTDAADLVAAARDGIITAVKLYPAGATTNSASGVRDIEGVMPVLEAMSEAGVPLCVHGEVTDSDVDIFDREAVFIDRVLDPLRRRLPELRVVMEHVTTSDGIDYVLAGGESIAATLTTHHLFINRNHILAGGIRPHYYCLPVAKRETHRLALVAAATSGDPSFFLGTDSAPHLDSVKLATCGCAGIYTAPNTLACLAQVFENEGALGRLDGFVARHGAAFYGVPVNAGTVTLVRTAAPQPAPDDRITPEGDLTVFDPLVPIHWAVEG